MEQKDNQKQESLQYKIYMQPNAKNECFYVQFQERLLLKVLFQNVNRKTENMHFISLQLPEQEFEKVLEVFRQLITKQFLEENLPKLLDQQVKGKGQQNNNALKNAIKRCIDNSDDLKISNLNYEKNIVYYSVQDNKDLNVYYRVLVPSKKKQRKQEEFKMYLLKNESFLEQDEQFPKDYSRMSYKQAINTQIQYNLILDGISYDSFCVKTKLQQFAEEQGNYIGVYFYGFEIGRGSNEGGVTIKVKLTKKPAIQNIQIFRIHGSNNENENNLIYEKLGIKISPKKENSSDENSSDENSSDENEEDEQIEKTDEKEKEQDEENDEKENDIVVQQVQQKENKENKQKQKKTQKTPKKQEQQNNLDLPQGFLEQYD